MKSEDHCHQPPSFKEQGYFIARYYVAAMGFLLMFFNYALRVNIHFTILYMVKPINSSKGEQSEDSCHYGELQLLDESYIGDYEWDELTQNAVSASFLWGYVMTQIPGGRLAEIMSAKNIIGTAMGATAILTLFVPFVSGQNAVPLIVVRILMGLAEGFVNPATQVIMAAWAPPLERSFLGSLIYSGQEIAAVVTFVMSAAIIKSLGWEFVFYVQGFLTLAWCVLWFGTITDEPAECKWMSSSERGYIVSSLSECRVKKAFRVPWKSVLVSVPYWALIAAYIGNGWGFNFLLTDLPLYMKEILKFDLKSNALLSGLPYLSMGLFSILLGFIGDKLRQKGKLSTTALRKGAVFLSNGGPAFCFLALSVTKCNRSLTVALLFVAVTLQGARNLGHSLNHIDLSPNFCGTLYGIANTFGVINNLLAPLTVGALTNNNQTFAQWNKMFYLTSGIYMVSTIAFLCFGSGEEQKWNRTSKLEEELSEEFGLQYQLTSKKYDACMLRTEVK